MSDKQKISLFNLSLAPMESSLGHVRLDVIIARAHAHVPAETYSHTFDFVPHAFTVPPPGFV